METPVLVAILVAVVVAFFGWQWWSASGKRRGGKHIPSPTNKSIGGFAPVVSSVQQEAYPEVVGQTEADLRAKEPLQQQPPAGRQPQPVTADGKSSAEIEDNLRHPEQLFHAPSGPTATAAVAAGIASPMSTPGFASTGPTTPPMEGHQQAFTPEMAMNGGAVVGDSVFAFDGMAPTTFAAF